MVYYNEFDPFAAQWLRNLIAAGHIAQGHVDERSVVDVRPADLDGYTQCHFFAGIGVWSYALRRAGWADDRPVWTGSCPCQPFSVAGQGDGAADERHLWPSWFWLIAQCRPHIVFGEQVEAAIRYGWIDLVQSDLEGLGYAVAPVGLPAAGFGAPHIRQRAWFVANTCSAGVRDSGRGADGSASSSAGREAGQQRLRPFVGNGGSGMGDSISARLEGLAGDGDAGDESGRIGSLARRPTSAAGADGRLADAASEQRGVWRIGAAGEQSGEIVGPARLGATVGGAEEQGAIAAAGDDRRPGPTNGYWRDADWLLCRDGKWRPVEPGTFPLAHGAPNRVGRLRGYGNAIVAPLAEEFIRAAMRCIEEGP